MHKPHLSFSVKLSAYVLLCTAAVFVCIFFFFYLFAGRTISEAANEKASDLLEVTKYKIENVFTAVKTAHNNIHRDIAENNIPPDSLYALTRRMLENNPYIFGCAIAFEPDYFKEKGYYFAPYSSRQGKRIETTQLGTEAYNYFDMEWYSTPKKQDKPHWTDPYFDEGGGWMLMFTYSTPLHNKEGEFIGVLTADVSANWLTDMVNAVKPYSSSYSVLLGRSGTYIVHPHTEYILHESIFSMADKLGDAELEQIGIQMINGKTGMAELSNTSVNDSVASYVYFTPLESNHWSLGMVVHQADVFKDLRNMRTTTIILLVAGLLLLFILCMFIFGKLRNNAAKEERIESELRIAGDIQMGMVPKVFPTFPEQKNIDLYACLYPAKEVGGDLYDFFIDNDRLYFIIGDVSGKGVPASLLMAVTRSLFRSMASHIEDPGEIVRSMNNAIVETNEAHMFVTLFVGVLHFDTGKLEYCNAGHNPPVLISQEGKVQTMSVKPHIPVGLFEGCAYRSETITIERGTTLFLYTDGLTEAENPTKELYTEGRLIHTLEHQPMESMHEMTVQIIQDINQHVNGAEQSDDIAILAIRYMENSPNV